MNFWNRTDRLAGVLYLVVVVTGIFSLAYVPSQIALSGDPNVVASNIMASERLFRLGIAAFLVKQVAFLLLPFALFKLLRPVGQTTAALMVALAAVSVPIALVGLSGKLDALSLLTDPRYAVALTPPQLHADVLLALGEYRSGLLITSLFWGLWLFPLGYLILRSGFLPKILGILLILGGFGYVIEVFGGLLIPGYADKAISRFVMLPASVGEIGTCLWLLIPGVRYPQRSAAHPATPADAAE